MSLLPAHGIARPDDLRPLWLMEREKRFCRRFDLSAPDHCESPTFNASASWRGKKTDKHSTKFYFFQYFFLTSHSSRTINRSCVPNDKPPLLHLLCSFTLSRCDDCVFNHHFFFFFSYSKDCSEQFLLYILRNNLNHPAARCVAMRSASAGPF